MTTFTDPKQLPCLHSFCLHCLKKWHRRSDRRDTIQCPECRVLSRVPASGDLDDLPTSFYLNGMIDALTIKECDNSQVRCGNCDKKSSESYYCFQCCIFWCKECVNGHDIIRSNKGHRILALKEFQDKDYEDVLKRPAFCPKRSHVNSQGKKEELKFFCTSCKIAVCHICVTLDHSGHTMKLIEDEAARQKIQMKTLVETQKSKLQEKINEACKADQEYVKLVQQGENVKEDVQRFVENLTAAIERKKTNIFAAVENERKKSLESLTTRKTEIEHQIQEIESSLEMSEKVLTRSTNAEIVGLTESLETTILASFSESGEPVSRHPECLPVFVENQELFDIVNNKEIGSLKRPSNDNWSTQTSAPYPPAISTPPHTSTERFTKPLRPTSPYSHPLHDTSYSTSLSSYSTDSQSLTTTPYHSASGSLNNVFGSKDEYTSSYHVKSSPYSHSLRDVGHHSTSSSSYSTDSQSLTTTPYHSAVATSHTSTKLFTKPFAPTSSSDIQLGMEVLVTRAGGQIGRGIVKYVGPLPGRKDNLYIGVELGSGQEGKHDGSLNGQRLFTCKPNRGIFVSFNKVVMCYMVKEHV
ncbi:hypothetical protein ACROYT_G020908 [Oculina patagonica]